jgi:hypothetical protein
MRTADTLGVSVEIGEEGRRKREEIAHQWRNYLANPLSLTPRELARLKALARIYGISILQPKRREIR